jgi:hypothetical protein
VLTITKNTNLRISSKAAVLAQLSPMSVISAPGIHNFPGSMSMIERSPCQTAKPPAMEKTGGFAWAPDNVFFRERHRLDYRTGG